MEKPKRLKNVLPNTYIPLLSKKSLAAILGRMTKNSLIDFMRVWPSLVNTQPQLDKENTGNSQQALNDMVIREAIDLKQQAGKVPKRKIVDKIIFEYWWKGLNVLQLSQLDCQLIVDRPNTFYWVSSVVKDAFGNESSISIDPAKFLDLLARDLSNTFMTYIYVCRHPRLPLMLLRVQIFDLESFDTQSKPHISSQRPYFIAFPLNSPYVIHSLSNDIISNIVLQAVEKCLPQTSRNLLKIIKEDSPKPIRSLEAMQVLYGSSRFGNSSGIWAPYADGTVDMLPLNAIEEHKELNPSIESDSGLSKREQIANLRFKGSIDGSLKSEYPYDDYKQRKRRKVMIEASEIDNEDDYEEAKKSEYASIAPIQYTEVSLQEKIRDSYSSITMKFVGTDVFAGLHELSVSTDDILNPAIVPSWLSGEENTKIIVKDGKVLATT